MVDSDFLNSLVMTVYPYVKGDELQQIKMQFDILLHDYDVKKMSTELTVYKGGMNDEMLLRFLRAKAAKGCTKRTVEFYQKTISKTLEKIGKPYNEVTPDDVRYYIAYRVSREGVTKTTVGNEIRNLSSFYTWLSTEEILLKNPMNKVDRVKQVRKKKKAFTQMDVEKIRAGCKTKREQAIIEVLLSTWCRVTELVNIKIADIKDGKCTVLGKGDKYREVFINARAQIAIKVYLAERKDKNPYLFPKKTERTGTGGLAWYTKPGLVDPCEPMDKGSVESLVRDIGKRVGVDNVHPHRFRRTGATMALRVGMPILQVSKLMGHENINTTQIYLDISSEELEASHAKYVV